MKIIDEEYGHELLKDGRYSDFTITCQGYQFHVHRNVVTPQSKFFRAVCDQDFKEKQDGHVDFPEEHPVVVAQVLKFIYTRDCDDPAYAALDEYSRPRSHGLSEIAPGAVPAEYSCRTPSLDDHFEVEIHISRFANKLGLPDLGSLTEERIKIKACQSLVQGTFVDDLQCFYHTITDSDISLRGLMLRFCTFLHLKHSETFSDAWEAIVAKHEPLTWPILKDAMGQCPLAIRKTSLSTVHLDFILTGGKFCTCGSKFHPVVSHEDEEGAEDDNPYTEIPHVKKGGPVYKESQFGTWNKNS